MSKEEKIKEVEVKPETVPTPRMRQILIETDGDIITLEKAEVSGKIELVAILQTVIGYINNQAKHDSKINPGENK